MSRFVSPLRRRSLLVASAGSALLAACGTKPPPPPKPTLVSGSIKASAGLNPSVTGRASPLQVRVYELKAPAAFNAADFMSLYQGDQGALGADMVARDRLQDEHARIGGPCAGDQHHDEQRQRLERGAHVRQAFQGGEGFADRSRRLWVCCHACGLGLALPDGLIA